MHHQDKVFEDGNLLSWILELYHLGQNVVQSVESQPTVRRNVSPLSSGSKNKQRLCSLPALCWLFAWLILRSSRWRRRIPPNNQLTFNGLHGVISQKIELFIATAVRASNPIYFPECSEVLRSGQNSEEDVKETGSSHTGLWYSSWKVEPS
jgi:hypothetical protein